MAKLSTLRGGTFRIKRAFFPNLRVNSTLSFVPCQAFFLFSAFFALLLVSALRRLKHGQTFDVARRNIQDLKSFPRYALTISERLVQSQHIFYKKTLFRKENKKRNKIMYLQSTQCVASRAGQHSACMVPAALFCAQAH